MAADADTRLRYACDTQGARLELMVAEAAAAPDAASVVRQGVEWIDVAPLLTYEERVDSRSGLHLRADSDTAMRRCGAYTVAIRAGFYNPNPQGEMGAAPDYPIVDISEAGRGHLATLALGVCAAHNPRSGHLVPCPSGWATRVLVVGPPAVRGTMLELRRSHDEIRILPPLPSGAPP